MLRKERQSILYSFIFLFCFLLFQLKIFIASYLFIFISLIILFFLKEKNRIFVWSMIAFLLAQFIYLYGNRFINNLHLPIYWLPVAKSTLLLFHCLFIYYIFNKFSVARNQYFKWKTSINSNKGSIIAGIMLLTCLSPLLFGFQLNMLFPIISFALINSVIEETLWRGLLLTLFISRIGKKGAIILTSALFGIFYLAYNLSFPLLFSIVLFGIILAMLTIRMKSIVPSFILHFIVNMLIVSSNTMFQPFFYNGIN